jgi:hypothetical protein
MAPAVSSVNDRFAAAWGKLLNFFLGRKAVKTVDACTLYRGRVVKQAGRFVDVVLDCPDIASPSNVPLLLGLPGATVSITPPAFVRVGFWDGDPSKPYALEWEGGETVTQLVLAYLTGKFGGAAAVEAFMLGTSFRTAQITLDIALQTQLGNLGTALTAAGNDTALQMVAPTAATQLGNAGTAATACAGAITAFETTAGLAQSFLSDVNFGE